MDILGGILVSALFLIYLILWKLKRASQIRKTGIDPDVLNKSNSNLQKFIGAILNILTFFAVILIVLHITNSRYYSLFDRFYLLDTAGVKFIGFFLGFSGLSFCLYAQIKMGQSWRVGIDTKTKTSLVQTGLYNIIRNPTYLGLFILNLGIWTIWPTWTMFLFNVLFIYTLEIQVRCEEDFLEQIHGETYIEYKKVTKRYIPFIY